MLKADFHIHTTLSKHYFLSKFNLLDGINTPDEMVKAAKEKGLDIIAITDHDVLFSPDLAKKLTKKYGILVLPGIELYLNKKDVIGIGLNELKKVSNLKEFSEMVHKQGGIVIAPHPYDPLGRGTTNFQYVDGIEVVNAFGPFGYKKLVKIADNLKKAKVCGSDGHCIDHLGYTYFLIDADKNKESVIKAIKDRKTKPVYGKIPRHVQIKYYFNKFILGKARKRS